MRLYVVGTGFAAPGLDSAFALRAHMDGAALGSMPDWQARPQSLPTRQQRRLSDSTRLAVLAAEQIRPGLPDDAGWIFASSVGEGQTSGEILTSLRGPDIMIQPIRFQNAVHNAAQGQWSIAAGAAGAATSIASYDDCAGAGLLKAMMQISLEDVPVGMVVYDAPLPEPLHPKRRFEMPMAAALALSPVRTPETQAVLEIEMTSKIVAAPADTAPVSSLLSESGNPTRFLLPLLARIWGHGEGAVSLSLSGGACLRVAVSTEDA